MNHAVSSSWMARQKKKWIPTLVGVSFSLLMAFLLYSKSTPISAWLELVEDKTYDFQVRKVYKPLPSHPPVVIVGLDDASLMAEGRLPWSREKMAVLVDRLSALGAKVIALDFLYPVEEANIAAKVFEKLKGKGANEADLSDFDYDAKYAKSLQSVDSVLGMVLTWNEKSVGVLPPPILTLSPQQQEIFIPEKNSFLGNIAILQNAARGGGFINSTPDSDAVIRFSPLVYRMGDRVFGSLAFVAVKEFLQAKNVKLIAKTYAETDFLEAIELDERSIPVDLMGRILVPYRGPAYSFSHISATDVLQGRVSQEAVQGKLVFVGATATGSGDLVSTPMSQSYSGVEVHATIAEGILDEYLPFQPVWAKGLSVAMVLIFGIALSLLLPRMGPLQMVFSSGGGIAVLFLIDYWMWSHERMVVTFFFPILTIGLLFLFNEIYGYLVEAKQRQAIKNVFGQYVSSEHIDLILKEGKEIELSGESKDLSVLFSDIRSFTSLSENMKADELTAFLNAYFTAMTEVILENQGTVDKYIGDAIMAFWGAPIDDPDSASHTVAAALAMQKRLAALNLKLAEQKKPLIETGIGISTGNVFVGDMGSKFRRSYTVMGDTVNLGSRLEGLTKRYHVKIIVSENTYLSTREKFLYRKLDRVQVKGKEHAVQIYEPLSSLDAASGAMKDEAARQNLALEAYQKGDWAKAKEIWTELASLGSNKPLYAMYLERMQGDSPLGPNWDGVQKYDAK